MARAQLKHLLLDADFFDKPKVKALLAKFGPTAQLYLVRLYALLSRATDAEISYDAAKGLAWELRIEEQSAAIIEYSITEGLLFKADSGLLSNSRVCEDQEALAGKRSKWRSEKKEDSETFPTGIQPESARKGTGKGPETARKSNGTIPERLLFRESEDLNTEDLKIEVLEGGAGETFLSVMDNAPAHLKTPEVSAALNRYRQALKKRHGRDFDEISVEALLCNYVGRTAEELARNLNYSAQNSYKTVVEAPSQNAVAPPNAPAQPRQKLTTIELNRERLEAIAKRDAERERASKA